MGATLGGTEIYKPLFSLLGQEPIKGYPKQIFLLTDGCVSNTEGVIKMVGLSNKYSRVHTIGIGKGCSQQLITGCADKGKGYHVFIDDN
jgi:von Willebrand factor A domain-containing protein 5